MTELDILRRLYVVTCINSGLLCACVLFLAALFLWPKDGAEPNG